MSTLKVNRIIPESGNDIVIGEKGVNVSIAGHSGRPFVLKDQMRAGVGDMMAYKGLGQQTLNVSEITMIGVAYEDLDGYIWQMSAGSHSLPGTHVSLSYGDLIIGYWEVESTSGSVVMEDGTPCGRALISTSTFHGDGYGLTIGNEYHISSPLWGK